MLKAPASQSLYEQPFWGISLSEITNARPQQATSPPKPTYVTRGNSPTCHGEQTSPEHCHTEATNERTMNVK